MIRVYHLNRSIQACKAVQQNVAESSSDHLALEIFLRDTTYRNLHSAAKSRESRLKEVSGLLSSAVCHFGMRLSHSHGFLQRIKAVHGLLSKLEQAEKAFIRALTDLKDEERKHSYLLGRKELDISEEIEKVEIDLRKCTSQLAVKREFSRRCQFSTSRQKAHLCTVRTQWASMISSRVDYWISKRAGGMNGMAFVL